MLYAKCKFKATLIEELSVTKNCIESVFIKFSYNRRTFIIGNIYRPPKGNLTEFTSEMCKFFDLICAQFSLDDLYLLGDYNIELFKINLTKNILIFIQLCSPTG